MLQLNKFQIEIESKPDLLFYPKRLYHVVNSPLLYAYSTESRK